MKKVLLLLPVIAMLSACGGSGSNETPTATATASISGPGITGNATLNVQITNVDMLNKARYLNGASSVNVDVVGSLKGNATINGESHSINQTESGTITLYASDARNAAGLPTSYTFSEQYCENGQCYTVSGDYDINNGNLRTDVDVVQGSSNDFFITNEGTGTQTALSQEQRDTLKPFYDNFNERGGNYAQFATDVTNALNEGWTGTGLEFTVNSDDDIILDLLPNAEGYIWNNDQQYSEIYNINQQDSIYVTSFGSATLEGYYIDELTEGSHALVAAGVGMLWNKFDTLDASQVSDIVALTADGKRFDLGAAMSPVGNLR